MCVKLLRIEYRHVILYENFTVQCLFVIFAQRNIKQSANLRGSYTKGLKGEGDAMIPLFATPQYEAQASSLIW